MPDRHVRALRDKLERLLQTTRKLEGEIADALEKAADTSAEQPAKAVNRRVAKAPRRKKQLKSY